MSFLACLFWWKMPWHIDESSDCPDSKPYAVIKDSDGEIEGCHETEESAKAQMAALYASEDKRMEDEKAISTWDLEDTIRNKLGEVLGIPELDSVAQSRSYWIVETNLIPQTVIVEIDSKYFEIPYSIEDTTVVLAPKSEWTQVVKTWIPASNMDTLNFLKQYQVIESVKKEDAESAIIETRIDRFMKTLKSKFGDVFGTKENVKENRGGEQKVFRTFKAKDGKDWLLVWTTNAFEDRDKEIFSTKAIEEYVERHADDEIKGEFRFWHIPGTKIGDIKWQGVTGRFLVEAGPFGEDEFAQAAKEFFDAYPDGHPVVAPTGWGTSHGFRYIEGDRADGVYEWFDKEETSILPRLVAANIHNPGPEVLKVNDKQRKALAAIAGDEKVDEILAKGDELTKDLEGTVNFKETVEAEEPKTDVAEEEKEPEEVVENTPADEAPEFVTKEDFAAAIDDVKEAVGFLAESLNASTKALADLVKSDEEKVAEIVEGTPAASIADMVKSVIGQDKTRVDGRTKEGRTGPEEAPDDVGATGNPVVDAITERNKQFVRARGG